MTFAKTAVKIGQKIDIRFEWPLRVIIIVTLSFTLPQHEAANSVANTVHRLQPPVTSNRNHIHFIFYNWRQLSLTNTTRKIDNRKLQFSRLTTHFKTCTQYNSMVFFEFRKWKPSGFRLPLPSHLLHPFSLIFLLAPFYKITLFNGRNQRVRVGIFVKLTSNLNSLPAMQTLY